MPSLTSISASAGMSWTLSSISLAHLISQPQPQVQLSLVQLSLSLSAAFQWIICSIPLVEDDNNVQFDPLLRARDKQNDNWTITTSTQSTCEERPQSQLQFDYTPLQQHQPNFSTIWHHNPHPIFFKENATTQFFFQTHPNLWFFYNFTTKLGSLLRKRYYNPNNNQNSWKENTTTTTHTVQNLPPQPIRQPQFLDFGQHNLNLQCQRQLNPSTSS